jgi:hypothetical protein
LRQPLSIVDARSSDLYWGNRLQPNELMPSEEEFARRLQQGRRVAIVVMDAHLSDFCKQPYAAGMQEVKRSGQLTVFMN